TDGLRLIRARSRLMKRAGELNPGGMAAILKLDDETVTKICDEVTAEGAGVLHVANYNSPGQVVISGHNAAVDRGIELALAAKARRAVRLSVSIPAHSALMQVIVDEFREAIDKTPLNLPEIPIIANITGEPLTSVEAIRTEMTQQLTSSVRWTASVRWMIDHGVTEFIEVGPKNVLTGIIRRVSKEVNTYNAGTPDEIKALLTKDA
ncbi:MAG: ACP S-malonyltransferase, partial [Anaerolineae bacterium]|nr:ACP S-malonyltransferase [Anaerolineae bacterium]